MGKRKKVEFRTRKGKRVSFSKKEKKAKRKEKIKVTKKSFKDTAKGRRGEYFYAKKSGKKGKYYKAKKGITQKDVREFYKRGIVTKRGGITKEKIKKERRLDKVAKKYPNIEETFGEKGYAEYTLRNAEKLTPSGIRMAYQYLLLNKDRVGDGKGIIRDKELLEIITRSENIEKWKHRVLFEVMLMNDKGEILSTIVNTQIKTLGEVKREVLGSIKTGQEYEEQYKTINEVTTKGYRVNTGTSKKGKIANVTIKLTFRKGA